MLDSVAEDLIQIVQETARDLGTLSVNIAQSKPSPEKWSVQEILGHLLDSAVNNHHRFVRAQQGRSLVFPKYDQEFWVDAQGYNDVPWPEVVTLWQLYNLHLARVITRIAPASVETPCTIGPDDAVTLGFLVEDYLDHLKHHLQQIRALIPNPTLADP